MSGTTSNILNPNVPGLDTAIVGQQPKVTTRASSFLATSAAGTLIAPLVDPFGEGSTYATEGSVPAQLALSNGTIVKGAGAAVPGVEYRIRIRATAADGLRETSTILSFATRSPIVVVPTPTPTPSVVPTSPSEAPSAAGNRTVTMTTRQTLPDGAYPLAAGVGYPCTGACWHRTTGNYVSAHGTDQPSLNAGFVILSPTFQLVAQYTVGSMGLLAGSVQGIDIDRSDDTLWFILKATANGAYLVHCTLAGQLISALLLTNSDSNGLCYDSRRDALVLMRDTGGVTWYKKPAADATALTVLGKTSFSAAGGNNDMLHYEPLRDEILISGGANNSSGTVDIYDVSGSTAALRGTLTLDQAMAIEGIVRRGDDLIAWLDQNTHPVPGAATNQVQIYAGAMVPTIAAPVFAFAAAPVAQEGDAQVFTLNVTRNGTLGALDGTYQVGAGSSPAADAADFGGTFPAGAFTIADGATSTTITITSSEDAVQEGDERYVLSASYGGAVVATVNAAIGEDDAPAGSYQPESEAFFARMTSQPSSARKSAIDTMIASLKSAGVLAKADGLYVYAMHEASAAQLNIVSTDRPVTLMGVNAPVPAFTVDKGWVTSNQGYLDFGFSPATATHFLQDSATLAVWRNDPAASATGTASIGVNGTTAVGLNPRATSDVMASRVNSSTATVGGASTDAKGLSAVSRTSSTTVQHYKNGAPSGAVGNATSAARAAGNFRSGRVNANDQIVADFGAHFIGAGLTADEHQALYTALATYMTAVGNT